eukprot:SM000121S25978  [mRNA]  locus=s121:45434:65270:- [translate_table: standard]
MQCTLDSLLVCSTGIAENILNELLYTVQPACCAAILANNKPSTCFCNTWLGKAVVAAEGRTRVVTLQALISCNISIETVGIPGTPACPPPPPRPSLQVPPSPGLRGERDALLRIRAALADPQGNLTGWSAADPDPCNWVGVTCSRSGGRFAVTTLDLMDLRLEGKLPAEGGLGNLTQLVRLYLARNNLTGAIPPELGRLQHLEPDRAAATAASRSEVLGRNRLQGHIPPELGRLSKLAYLHLSDNFLEGSLPDELGNLSSLSWLAIARAGLSGRIPSSLGRLQLLYNLLLSENRLTGEIPPELSNSAFLETILVHFNRLTGTLPRELGAMKKLLTLDVRGNLLEGPIPPELGNATKLSILSLSENRFTGGIPVELGQLGSLKRLELAGNRLTGPIPPSLGNCTNLFQLNISYNGLVGSIPMELGNIRNASVMDIYLPSFKQPNVTKLQYIDITSNALSGPLPATLGRLSAMQAFYFSSNQLTGSIPPSISNCYQLLQLNLSHNKLSGPLWPGLGLLTNLTKVDLSNNAFTGPIPSELHSLFAAQTLDLAHNRFSGNIPPELGLLVSVTRLALDSNILDGLIPTELGNMSSLEDLDLSNNKLTGLMPATLEDIPLIFLNVSHNKMSGSLPASLGQLQVLQVMDVSVNNFSGPVPSSYTSLSKLKYFNASYNDLSGVVPSEGPTALRRRDAYLGNSNICNSTNICQSSTDVPPPTSAPASPNHKDSNGNMGVILGCSLGGSAAIIGLLILFCWKSRRHSRDLAATSKGFDDASAKWLLIYDFVNGGNLDTYLWAASSMMLSTTATAQGAFNQEMHLALGAQKDTAEQLTASGVPVVEAKSLHHDAEEQKRRAGHSAQQIAAPQLVVPVASAADIWQDILAVIKVGLLCTAAEPSSRPTMAETLHLLDNTNALGLKPSPNWQLYASPSTYSVSSAAAGPGSLSGSSLNSILQSTSESQCTVDCTLENVLPCSTAAGEDILNEALYTVQPACCAAVRANTRPDKCRCVSWFPREPACLAVQRRTAGARRSHPRPAYAERDALLRVKAALADPQGNLSDWAASAPTPCSWSGVTCCAAAGRTCAAVVKLDLMDMKLAGELPAAAGLGDLGELVRLYLSRSALTGAISIGELARLSRLQVLHLDGNNFTRPLPDELGDCKSLRVLDVNSNPRLTGALPSSLGRLSRLYFLYLSHSGLSGPLPPELGNATALTTLDRIPASLSRLPLLHNLIVAGNQLSGGIPAELGQCKFRESIYAQSNWLDGTLPKEPGDVRTLLTIELHGNMLTGTIPPEIARASKLHILSLSGNQLSGGIPPELGRLANLTRLHLDGNRLSGLIPPSLGNCSNLFQINQLLRTNVAAATRTTDSGTTSAPQLKQLKQGGPHHAGSVPTDIVASSLTGPIPEELSGIRASSVTEEFYFPGFDQPLVTKLQYTDVSDNRLTGQLPPSLGRLAGMQAFYFGGNRLQGGIPSSFKSAESGCQEPLLRRVWASFLHHNFLCCALEKKICIKNKSILMPELLLLLTSAIPQELADVHVQNLNLSHNMLSGSLPDSLGKQQVLQSLDVFNNNLSGRVPASGALPDSGSAALLNPDGYLGNANLCGIVATCVLSPSGHGERHLGPMLGCSVSGASAVIGCLLLLCWIAYRPSKFEQVSRSYEVATTMAKISRKPGFSSECGHLMGDFEGRNRTGCEEDGLHQPARREVSTLGRIKHRHLASLRGAYAGAVGAREWLLTYNFERGGNLESYLRDRTVGYLAPEYAYLSRVSEKSDVYSYGVVLLQLITGQHPTAIIFQDYEGGIVILALHFKQAKQHSRLLRPMFLKESAEQTWQDILAALKVGLICTAREPSARPTMAEVIHLLDNLHSISGSAGLSTDWQLNSSYTLLCSTAGGEDILNEVLYTVQPACCAAIVASARPDKCRCNPWILREMAAAEGLPLATTLGAIASCNIPFLSLGLYGTPSDHPRFLWRRFTANRTGPEVASTPGLRAERDALLRVKAGLADPQGNLSDWTAGAPTPCSWNGVTCGAAAGRAGAAVVKLDLMDMKLAGELPAAAGLGDLGELVRLYLSRNALTGAIPGGELARMSRLQVLHLDGNNFTGPLPNELGDCKNLRVLDVNSNPRLTGAVPSSLGCLKRLYFLYLSHSGLSGPLPPELGNATALTTLDVELLPPGLTGPIPAELGQLSRLRTLRLRYNSLTGPIPATLANCSELLGYLHLSDNPLTGTLPDELGNLTSVSWLAIARTNISGHIPASLSRLPLLHNLIVAGNQLSGGIPAELGRCKSLESIHAQYNQLDGTLPKELGDVRTLLTIELRGNMLTGTIPPEIARASKLHILSLSGNRLSGGIPPELGRLSNLTRLHLAGNRLSGVIPPSLGHCSNLFQLNVSSNRLTGPIPQELGGIRASPVTEEFYLPGFDQPLVTKLQYIDISDNRLTGQLPPSLGRLAGMQAFYFGGNRLQGGIPSSFLNCSRLLQLDLSGNSFSGPLWPGLGMLSNLTAVVLSGNSFNGSIPRQLRHMQGLQILDLAYNRFSGSIPPELGELTSVTSTIPQELADVHVQNLNLSHNMLSGSLPDSLGKQQVLQSLDVSYNNLSGPVPASYSLLPMLRFFNASYNDLSGALPDSGSAALLNPDAYLGNANLCDIDATCASSPSGNSERHLGLIIGCSVGGAAAVIGGLLLFCWIAFRPRKNKQTIMSYQSATSEAENQKKPGFSSESGQLMVYHKAVLKDGTELAVKKMACTSLQGEKEFLAEVSTLGRIKHRHLASLRGAYAGAVGAREWLLIYNFVRGGNLESYLRDSSSVISQEGSSEAANLEGGQNGPQRTVAELGAEEVCMADRGEMRDKLSVSALDANEQKRRQRPQNENPSCLAAKATTTGKPP